MSTPPSVVLAGVNNDPTLHHIALALLQLGQAVKIVGLGPPTADDREHETRFREALADVSGPAILGGFSLGARVAVQLSPHVQTRGLLCFGYPFHAAKAPHVRHGLEALGRVSVPTRIVQGTRDGHGTEAEVRGYQLSEWIEMVWLADGNHRFVPRVRSGFTEAAHLRAAAVSALSFIRTRTATKAVAP